MKRLPFFCRRSPSWLEVYYTIGCALALGFAIVAVFMEQGPTP